MPRLNPLTETEFRSGIQLLSNEIENVITIFHTYEEINRLTVEDSEIFRLVNKDALFWNVQRYCLPTSLFIVLARIFDESSGS